MNDKQKQELLVLIAEYGEARHRGMDISAQLAMIEIQKRVKEATGLEAKQPL